MAHDQKQQAILEAALKRFAHFGVAKTTMSEIAADLSISKASLYYYFPDKLNLYAAVFTYITENSEVANSEALQKRTDPFQAVLIFLQNRTDFIIKYYNILEYLKTFNVAQLPPELQATFTHLRKREMQHLTTIIQNGMQQNLFKIKDAQKTASLFFDFLNGFRTYFLNNNTSLFPDKKQFQTLLKKESEFAVIFFNGLTIENT